MRKSITLLAAALLISLTGFSNNYKETSKESGLTFSVSGKILDISTGEALAGVKVFVEETETHAYSDFDGNFEINGLYPGQYTLTTTFISYESAMVNLDIESAEEPEILEVKLEQVSK
jgi:hypothetical protein